MIPKTRLRGRLGMASEHIHATPIPSAAEPRRTEITCQVCPACLISRASPTVPGIARINWPPHWVLLSASRRRIVLPSPSTARLSSICSRCCCTAVSVEVGRRKKTNTAKHTIRSSKNNSIDITDLLALDAHRVFKHRPRNRDTRRFELFGKFGPDSGRSKRAQHPAIRRHSLLFENENILHANHVVFHAGDLGKMSHAP